MALQEFKIVSEQLQSLFKLKTAEKDASEGQHPKAMMQSQELLDSFHTKPLNEEIYQVCSCYSVHVGTYQLIGCFQKNPNIHTYTHMLHTY